MKPTRFSRIPRWLGPRSENEWRVRVEVLYSIEDWFLGFVRVIESEVHNETDA